MPRKFKNKNFFLGSVGLIIAAVFLFIFGGFFTAHISPTNKSNIVHAQSNQSIPALEAQLAALQAQLIALLTQLGLTNAHFDRNLTVGSIGTDVTTLQNWLIFKKFLNLGSYPKGHFGVLTKAALIKWQRSVAISPASGYFGPVSRAKLNSILNIPIVTPPILPPPPNPLGLVISCSPNTTQVALGGSATWQAQVTGGNGSYTYSWQGTDGLTGSTATVQKTYTVLGVKSASVSINNQTPVQCSLNLSVSNEQVHNNIAASSFSVDVYKDQSLTKYADHAMIFYGVGGNSTYAPYRYALREEDPLPVSYWHDSQFSAEMAWFLTRGFQRILLHNPFGQTPPTVFPNGCVEGEQMQFDQYLEAQETAPWLVNGFVEKIKPLVESGVEVIGYIGSPDSYGPGSTNGDCEQQALLSNPSEWWARAWSALQPFLDSGMSIAFDAAVGTDSSSYTYQLAEALRARGVRVYVESVPEARNPHWASYPFIMSNDQWSWLVPGNGSSVPLSQLSGEIFRFVRYPSQFPEQIRQILSEGYTAEINRNVPLRQAVIDYIDPTVTVDLTANSNSPAGVNYNIKTNPTSGSLNPIGAGKYAYSANSGFVGTDTFTYTASSGIDESLPATVTVNVHAEMPFVTAQQLMTAAKQASGNSSKVVSTWPLFDKDIQRLGINSIISANMVPKRVITFQMGSVPTSYIAGYDKKTFAPMAISAGRVLIADASNSSGSQYAAVVESKTENMFVVIWNAIIGFFAKIFSYIF